MKRIVIWISILLFGLIVYLLLFGKLFVFSPLILGFTKNELSNTIIYVQNGADYTGFKRLDTLTRSVEKFHELKFKKKPEIYIFKDRLYFIRRSFSKARFSAYPSGRLLVSPWAVREDRAGKISLEIYVRHELSHILLMQYMSYLKAYNYPQWLMEGIAVYSTNQMGTSFYPSKDETYNDIAKGNFLPPLDFKTNREDKAVINVKYPIAFKYSEFACIVDYLVENYGKDKLLIFMKKLFENSNNNKVFKETYNIEFTDFIQDFKNQVIKNQKQNRNGDYKKPIINRQ